MTCQGDASTHTLEGAVEVVVKTVEGEGRVHRNSAVKWSINNGMHKMAPDSVT